MHMYIEVVAMKTASQARHTTAAIWFRFASPKFLLHCVPQKLHIAAKRYRQYRTNTERRR